MADMNGSHLDRKQLELWAENHTLIREATEVDGIAQEIRDAIPDNEMPDDLDSALSRLR